MKTIKTSEKRRHKNEIIMIKNSPNYNYISEVRGAWKGDGRRWRKENGGAKKPLPPPPPLSTPRSAMIFVRRD